MLVLKVVAVGIIAAALATVMPMTVNAVGSDATVQILPLDCVFETVQDGSNQITYLTPEACGQVTPPSLAPGSPLGETGSPLLNNDAPNQTAPDVDSNDGQVGAADGGAGVAGGSGNGSGTSTGGGMIEVDKYKPDYAPEVWLWPNKAMVFMFIKGNKQEMHRITLVQKGDGWAELLLQSTPQQFVLKSGATQEFDFDYDNDPDLRVELKQVADQNALVRLWPLNNQQTAAAPLAIPVIGTIDQPWPWLIIVSASIAATLIYVLVRRHRRQ